MLHSNGNYGLIFGEYWYGGNLGTKILGVPLTIGINWAVLSFIFGSLASRYISHKWMAAIVAAAGMVFLDFLIEPVAGMFDFWHWKDADIPLQNYIGWYCIALPLQLLFQYYVPRKELLFSTHLIIVQLIFFGIFNIVHAQI